MNNARFHPRSWIVGLLSAGLLIAGLSAVPAWATEGPRFDMRVSSEAYSGRDYDTRELLNRVEHRRTMVAGLEQKFADVERLRGERQVDALVRFLREMVDQQRTNPSGTIVSSRYHPENFEGRHYDTEWTAKQAALRAEARHARLARVDSMIARLERTGGRSKVDDIVLVIRDLVNSRLAGLNTGTSITEVVPAYASAGRLTGRNYDNHEMIQRSTIRARDREFRKNQFSQRLASLMGLSQGQKINSVVGLLRDIVSQRRAEIG